MASELLRIRMTKVPFNCRLPNRGFAVIREMGTYPVGRGKGEVDPDIAQLAVDEGYAQAFNPRSRKRATGGRGSGKPLANAADTRQPDRVDRADMAAADRSDGEPPVDDAG